MTTRVRKRLRALFIILALLAIAQLGWWSYLLIDQQAQISQILQTQDAYDRESRFLFMIFTEGGFWFIMWTIGLYSIYKTFMQERRLYQAHRDFLSAVTHELKTPIAGVQLGFEALRRDLSPEKKEVFIKRGLDATEKLKFQIEHILSLSQQDSQIPKHRATFNLKQLVEECIEECTHDFHTNVQWQMAIDENFSVTSQRESLKVIIKSVIDNALKYGSIADNSPSQLFININYSEGQLSISDNGIGFEENADNLFIDFFRGNIAKELAIPGTGVGLSVARQMADKLGYEIEISSPGQNKGCTCKIRMKD
ncbi:MAG: HAMP domain-containing sensor histidine kinase [Bdellovibrionota bacterium]|nr:HAMP domain-containing sensor histidine kinase [Bdellovibrionota bacterium]